MPTKPRLRKFDEDELPDFLEDSPFLPVWDHDEPRRSSRPKTAGIAQVLKSKPARLSYGLVILLFVLSWLHSVHFYDRLTGPSCYFRDPVVPDASYRNSPDLDWTQYAYALYATDVEYLCNAVTIFDTLERYGNKADRLLLYADTLGVSGEDSREGKLLSKARDELGVNLQPVKVLHEETAAYSGPNWADSYTKLLAFNQTQYSRLIVMDSDSMLLGPIDELFFVPPATAVMPRAYWVNRPLMSSHIMVLTPSADAFHDVQQTIDRKAGYGFYDMEVMNYLFGRTCQVMPHAPYALLTGEFRRMDHAAFLESGSGSGKHGWDPDVVLLQAKVVHFSDHPLPKPWLLTDEEIKAAKPDCSFFAEVGEECAAQEIWMELYMAFRYKRASACS
ncbi:hypothetical protein VSDG_07299 [Cytospora chrysosperma]|uniref:Glycosyltransferase family 8 protein n=1 Tax=Cytospora chrysosperma TaxID=252740 RepID=A0A423VMM4_CYTCH|nr:hypothetical protein VSDG_07299 [Valsa sordida]